MKAPALFLFLMACGSGGNGSMSGDDVQEPPPDAPTTVSDAPPSNVPAMVMLKGTTTETGFSGTTPVSGVAVAVYKITDEATPLAMGTSDAQGNYTLNVPTGGVPLDAYVKATKASYLDIYLYPSAAYVADDMDGEINMMTPGNRDLLDDFANGNQDPAKGMIGLAVFDANGMPVAGATIQATPAAGATRYMGNSGLPDANATMTSNEGVAFLFSAPTEVTVTAVKNGMTFHPHVVKARPGTFTTTSIAP